MREKKQTKFQEIQKRTYYETAPLTQKEVLELIKKGVKQREDLFREALDVILGRVKILDTTELFQKVLRRHYKGESLDSSQNTSQSGPKGKNRKRRLLLS